MAFRKTYPLIPAELLKSNNPDFKKEDKEQFNFTRHEKKGGIDQVIRDAKSTLTFKKFNKTLNHYEPLTRDEFLNALTPKNRDRIDRHITQHYFMFLSIPGDRLRVAGLNELPKATEYKKADSKEFLKAPEHQTVQMVIVGENRDQEIFAEVEGSRFPVIEASGKSSGEPIGYIPGKVEAFYKLTDKALEYQTGSTDSVFLHQLYTADQSIVEDYNEISKAMKKELILIEPKKSNTVLRQTKIRKVIQYIEQRIKPLQLLAEHFEAKNPTESNLMYDHIDLITPLLTKKTSTHSLFELSQGTDEIFQQAIINLWAELRTEIVKITNDLKKSLPEKANPAVIPEVTTLIDSLQSNLPVSLDEAISLPFSPASDANQLEEKLPKVNPPAKSVVTEQKQPVSPISALSQPVKGQEQKTHSLKREQKGKTVNKSKSSLRRAGVWLGFGAFAFAAGMVLSVFFGPVAALAGAAVLTLSLERAKTHYYNAVEANEAFLAEENSKQDKAVKQNDHLAANDKERKVHLAQPKRLLAIQTPPKPNINDSKTRISGSPTSAGAQLPYQIRDSKSTPPSSPSKSNSSLSFIDSSQGSPEARNDRNSDSENPDFQPRHRLGMSGSPT